MRLRIGISEKVVGSKLDKFGRGMIGKRKGSGESDGEKFWNECLQSCHTKN